MGPVGGGAWEEEQRSRTVVGGAALAGRHGLGQREKREPGGAAMGASGMQEEFGRLRAPRESHVVARTLSTWVDIVR